MGTRQELVNGFFDIGDDPDELGDALRELHEMVRARRGSQGSTFFQRSETSKPGRWFYIVTWEDLYRGMD